MPCTIIPQCNCQLSVQNLWFHQGVGWYSLLLLLLRRMLTCGYRSPLAAPLHLALQIPPSPLLPCSYLHIPYTTLQHVSSQSAVQTLLFSFLSLQLARVHIIQNLGPADGYKVQSVEVRSCREFRPGFDLHKLV